MEGGLESLQAPTVFPLQPSLPNPNAMAPLPHTSPIVAGSPAEPEEDNPFADELVFKESMLEFQKTLIDTDD